MTEWIYPELLNDWKNVPNFEQPRYKVGEDFIDFLGVAEGSHDKPILKLPPETKRFWGRWLQRFEWKDGKEIIVRWTIDEDGYLWYKEKDA